MPAANACAQRSVYYRIINLAGIFSILPNVPVIPPKILKLVQDIFNPATSRSRSFSRDFRSCLDRQNSSHTQLRIFNLARRKHFTRGGHFQSRVLKYTFLYISAGYLLISFGYLIPYSLQTFVKYSLIESPDMILSEGSSGARPSLA